MEVLCIDFHSIIQSIMHLKKHEEKIKLRQNAWTATFRYAFVNEHVMF